MPPSSFLSIGMQKLIIYQKPTCSTCRIVVRTLKEAGKEFLSVNYYETPLTIERLKELCVKMGITPRQLLRTKEPLYKKLKLGERDLPDDDLLALMVKNPDLLQRPIIEKGTKAILARPAEKVNEILS